MNKVSVRIYLHTVIYNREYII